VAVYAGESVTFQCITDGVANANVRWWEYVSSSAGVLISDGSTLLPSHPNYARYELILSDSRTFNLKINNVTLSDAGYYQCQDSNAAPPSTINIGVQLVVIGRQNRRVASTALGSFRVRLSLLLLLLLLLLLYTNFELSSENCALGGESSRGGNQGGHCEASGDLKIFYAIPLRNSPAQFLCAASGARGQLMKCVTNSALTMDLHIALAVARGKKTLRCVSSSFL
jgi:hypothetical protein